VKGHKIFSTAIATAWRRDVAYRRYPALSVKPVHPPRTTATAPRTSSEGLPLACRILGLTFRNETQRAAALAPWSMAPSQVWVSPRQLSADEQHVVDRLTDPRSTIGVQSIGQSRHATGKVVCIVDGRNCLLTATTASLAGVVMWKRAALSVSHTSNNPGSDLVRWLLDHDAAVTVASAGPVDLTLPTIELSGPSEGLWSHPVRQLLLTYFALTIRTTNPELIDPLGAVNQLLHEVASSPLDQRYHLPDLDGVSSIALPPDCDRDESGVVRWLNAPVTPGPHAVSRLIASVHRSRTDLAEAFPDLSYEHHRVELWRWVAAFGTDRVDGAALPEWACRPPSPLPRNRLDQTFVSARTNATTVVGYFDAALGLGEAARLCVRSLELVGEPVETVSYRHVVSDVVSWKPRHRYGQLPTDIELLCVSGADLPRWSHVEPPTTGIDPYRIGLWFWETDRLSPQMAAGFDFVDEVWATSQYAHDAIAAAAPSRLSVHVMPFAVSLNDADQSLTPGSRRARERAADHCSSLNEYVGRRWCGFSFDLASRVERKNPHGLIDAWMAAFPSPADAVLVIKTMNGAAQSTALSHLRGAAKHRDDIVVINETWSPTQHHNFIRALSVYASLHRSEGYGLVLLEAMAQGVPVVATGASGNLAFMTDANSWLIPAQLVSLQHDDGVYSAGDNVFEPDLFAASDSLQQVLSADPESTAIRTSRVSAAVHSTAALADGTAAATWMAQRLLEIRRDRAG
jgi:glycosyltransferase involved in cell wall biosynthesis